MGLLWRLLKQVKSGGVLFFLFFFCLFVMCSRRARTL